jgi:Protein of unknown function (DUF3604)
MLPRRLLTSLALALPVAACSSTGTLGSSQSTSGAGGATTGTSGTTGTGGATTGTTATTGAGGNLPDGGSGGGADGGPTTCPGTGATGYNTYKYAYYGDLHLHTSFSLDAYSFGTRSDPANAYLFAKGQAVVHVGSGTDGVVGPDITQARPIDFLAVTDHSEWLLVTHGCTVDMNSGYYNDADCGLVRSVKAADQNTVFGEMDTLASTLSTADPAGAKAEDTSAWQSIQAAAKAAYAPCQFTSLVAYEWTDSQTVIDSSTNMSASVTNHRNVIFANDNVPAAPLDATDYPTPPALWTGLDAQCTAASGCDVITIPHNTNISAGVSLVVWDPTPAGVAQQQKYQISAEVYQHKGCSECYYSPAEGYTDTDCQFEYVSDTKKAINLGPKSFVREGLASGLGYAAQNTAQGNPLKLGIVGATDDHNGAPGNVDEAKFVGHTGDNDDIPVKRLQSTPDYGSGALTGAWAEENTRESIYAAIKRRETFATSGPRLQVRFYQTTDATACADPSFPQKIIDEGAAMPMGSTLGAAALGGAAGPMFALTVWPDAVAQSLADGTTAVAGIAKVQIIKLHAKMVNGAPAIVEDPPNAVSGIPATGGCATWTDATFDPTEYALYYVRALQVPTWRWSHWSCATLEANNPTTWQTLVPGCVAGGPLDVSIQERAWTSPIWFEP